MTVQNEQEAIVAILIASVHIDDELTDFETDKLANTLVFCVKFKNVELSAIFRKMLIMKNEYGSVQLIRMSVPFIESNFVKTLYAMVCDVLCSDGHTSETDIQLMAMIAGELNIPEEDYLPIASTFMARYVWNLKFDLQS